MSREANSEQLIAIEKMDGVLLSAGAGSGKTFVIVEHIIKKIIAIKTALAKEKWPEEIGNELSKLVLMTFTKKASGEMSIRLLNRVEEQLNEQNNSDEFWSIVHKNLNRIQVSTIHGFCNRLLGFGFWPQFPKEIVLLNDFAHHEKLKKLFKKWLSLNKESLSSLYLSHSSDLLKAMLEIFSSPDLRIIWEREVEFKNKHVELVQFFNEWNNVKDYKLLFSGCDLLNSDPKRLQKKSFAFMVEFSDLCRNENKLGPDNYKKFLKFFSSIERFPSALKDFSQDEINYRLAIKNLFDDLQKMEFDLSAMEEFYPVYLEWENTLKDAFDYINTNYLSEPGFSYSDLEYYSLKGLSSSVGMSKIHEMFTYFVVDEFQDTSAVQFEIVRHLIGNDYSRLFCVGDKKQAIYGFRGGELAVFSECSRLLGKDSNLTLNSNYRSLKEIVNFNNHFFEYVLPIGAGYEGIDNHSVAMEFQNSPAQKNEKGEVVIYKNDFKVNNEEKSKIDIDWIEAKVILEAIKLDLLDDKIREIAILYRKLRPSLYLIDLLREAELPFSAQVKIQFENDPIIDLFMHSVLYLINFKDLKKRSVSEFHIEAILNLIGLDNFDKKKLLIFNSQYPLLGISASFWKFIYEIGISNAYYKENAAFIENVISIAGNDILRINQIISKEEGGYSTEVISGVGRKIVIMSTHASKGLEFDSVILGGVHRNGHYEGMKAKVGKMPKSFKWKKNYAQKKYFKSPFYYLESEIMKLKEFSESKRLFYVAATRAVRKLSWTDVSLNSEVVSSFSDSWINALRKFPIEGVKEVSILLNEDRSIPQEKSLIQKDNMGILPIKNGRKLGIVSELSVTRLATLVQCPFKFYLKNICKIEESFIFDHFEEDDNMNSDKFLSSMQRGSDLHRELSMIIKKLKKPESEIEFWVTSEIEKIKYINLSSEKEIKFLFFGQMITAIPDLILQGENLVYIWDFKTGHQEKKDEDAYWFQLSAYAFGHALLNSLDQEYEFELSLVYLDQKDLVSKRLRLKDISNYLFNIWEKTDNLHQVNLEHCKFCNYSKLCKSSSVVASN